ncbi:MAG: C40 family peptidase [Lachnospiraceae bacterium]|nr:C40 family peptidase [Lachnospiraceae bacterium]
MKCNKFVINTAERCNISAVHLCLERFMNFKSIRNTMLIVACASIFVFPSMKTNAAEISQVVNAGVATAIEHVEDEVALATAVAPSVVEGYTVLGIVDAESGYINIRKEANTESEIVGKIAKNAICEVISTEAEWFEIESGEVKGYISGEYLLTGISANQKAESLMAEGAEFETALTMIEYRYGKGVTDIQMEICEYARQFVGNPYRWGGTSLTKGADCSGFTLSVYAKYGVSLPHSSKAQANCGTRIDVSEVQPGDLVFYGGSNIHHVAMYIGNGQVVHAQSAKTGIVISSMYYNTPTRAVRLLELD